MSKGKLHIDSSMKVISQHARLLSDAFGLHDFGSEDMPLKITNSEINIGCYDFNIRQVNTGYAIAYVDASWDARERWWVAQIRR
jgi:hypothetical protein